MKSRIILIALAALLLTSCSSKVSEDEYNNIFQQGYDTGYTAGLRDGQNGNLDWANYVLNINRMEFHDPSCSRIGMMKIDVIALYGGKKELLVDKGFTPCQECNP